MGFLKFRSIVAFEGIFKRVFELAEQEKYQLDKYGRLHRRFLKEHHPARYSHIILEGQIWNYLVEIDKLCNDRMEVMIDAMKQQEGVTEALKVSLLW